MQKLLMAAVVVLSFGGCSKDKWDSAMSEYEGLKDKMCKCADKACTDAVNDERKTWEKSMREKFKDEKPPESMKERGQKIEKEMRECRRKFDKPEGDMGAPTPGAPEAAPPAPNP